ncbi:AAA family ATPase [Halobacillus sp. Nhm2S1]|uniref:AAA family ATPase n=1 Tax=Halobacillus sp. Nhm2S1 TaxID=2866716 RepID=UPI002107E0F4|nr:AAA family ATPase [Halobacillus sp. Nhm2S1]
MIKELTMHHFRQFYGTQTINFAYENDQMVTVILGENGRGKTGLYRAVLYAMFGDRFLEQDDQGKGLLLANSKALQEDAESEHKGVETYVQITFSHEGKTYTLYRSQIARKKANKVDEAAFDLHLYDYASGVKITKKEEIDAFIYGILDERVKHYFFFDGERIERLTRTNQEQKLEISQGIRNLLKIDQAIKSRDVLKHLLKKTTKELQKNSTGEYKKALKQRDEISKEEEKVKEEIASLVNLIDHSTSRLEEIDFTLQRFEKEKELIQRRSQLESQMSQIQERVQEAKEAFTSFHSTMSLLLAKDVLLEVKKQLDLYLGEDRQEDTMSSKGIEELLHDLTCICGRDFQENSPEYVRLQALYNAVQNQEANQNYHHLRAEIMQLNGFLQEKETELQQHLNTVKKEEQKLEEVTHQLERLNQQLSGSSESKLMDLNKEREKLTEEKSTAQYQLQQWRDKLSELDAESKKLDLKIRDLKVKSGVHQQLIKKEETLSSSIGAMNKMIDTFEKDVIEDLEMASTQNLEYLLDESGQAMLKEVKVNEDYSLEVLNCFGQAFLANISQGQRQVLSLSFITALAQVAGGTRTLEMPLFMDTPFGRLSSKHQENLMSFIPQITSQWVLLVTDREYDEEAKRKFEQLGYIGRYYRLESTEAGVTQIREQQLERGGRI